MSVKRYSHESFFINVPTVGEVECWTTDTRNGFCHHARIIGVGEGYARMSYLNRTWESFRYESVLRALAGKLHKKEREAMNAEIDAMCKAEKAKAEESFQSFKSLHDSLSPDQKKFLAEHTPHIETEGQMNAVKAVMGLMKVMGE